MKNINFKKIFLMLTMISVAALFAACTNNEIQETLAHTGRGYVLEYSDSNDIQNQFQGSTKTFDNKKEAFTFALNNLLMNLIVPGDVTQLTYDKKYGNISDNTFAICDINGDGSDELIVKWTTAAQQDTLLIVCRFDEKTKTLYQTLIETAASDFYNNGKVIALWADPGTSYGKYFWPFSVYEYDKRGGYYTKTAMVTAWSKELKPVDSNGNPYPDDIDTENAGEVYLLNDFSKADIQTISRSAYEKWIGEITKSGKCNIDYKSLTKENINQVGNVK